MQIKGTAVQVTLVDGGWRHSMAATAASLYAWGWNKFGQLGICHSQDKCSPTSVPLPSGPDTRVVRLSCGWKHTLLVTDKGDFYAMGRGTNGQLGAAVQSDQCGILACVSCINVLCAATLSYVGCSCGRIALYKHAWLTSRCIT
jgi:alpha-tubulin suppressor-like RCC1 family protein